MPARKCPTITLVASGDFCLSANQTCWPAQEAMESALTAALNEEGCNVERAHAYKKPERHGFIASQREGIEIFRTIDPNAPLIVAEAVWQHSHHVLPGLTTHRGPILTVSNWDGKWPGLVGMLNLNGSLTKAGISYSTLWSADFTVSFFKSRLRQWLKSGHISHDTSHARPLAETMIPTRAQKIGRQLATELRREKAILGVFDEGCMGMFNAIIPDHALHACGVFKERLSQSALYYETTQVLDAEARDVRGWLEKRGMRFYTGPDDETDLTDEQIHLQCKMYIAATRLADDFGCDAIGIQYQYGLRDLLPASDLVEGMLNNSERPPVRCRLGKRALYRNVPLPHFNEVDECGGLDALFTLRVHAALGEPLESTLHDVRFGEEYSGEFVWVFLNGGGAPPAHFLRGWKGAEGFRQPAMRFPNGGSTLRGISKPGEIVWSRIYVKDESLHMDIGRGAALALPREETERLWKETTPEWPIMHVVTYGVSRDQFMAKHQAHHVQVAYAANAKGADECMFAKAAMADALGIRVNVCGTLTR